MTVFDRVSQVWIYTSSSVPDDDIQAMFRLHARTNCDVHVLKYMSD